MNLSLSQLKFRAAVALIAFVWSVLHPVAVMLSMPSVRTLDLSQLICGTDSRMNMMVVTVGGAADSGSQSDESPSQRGSGHCALCALHAQLLLPTSDYVFVLRQEMRQGLPARFLSAPSTAAVWRAAQARAPPHSFA